MVHHHLPFYITFFWVYSRILYFQTHPTIILLGAYPDYVLILHTNQCQFEVFDIPCKGQVVTYLVCCRIG